MMLEKLDADVLSLLTEIESLGFSLCLVGGAVRDYLIDQSLGKDLDFEIRSLSKNMNEDQWVNEYSKLIGLFEHKNFLITKYPYLITRISLNGYDLEFSSPRIENQIEGNATHHHFNAVLDGSLSFEQSFKRRDITINSIGICFDFKTKTEKIINPYAGVEDLKSRTLRHLSGDFFFDPVRFLRLARFKIKMHDFSIAKETLKELSRFNLQDVTVHYLKQEAFKSHDAGRFFNLVASLRTSASLGINQKLEVVFQLSYPDGLYTIEQVVAFAIMTDKTVGIKIAKIFSISEKTIREISSFCDSVELLSAISSQELKQLLEKDFSLLDDEPILKEFKDMFDKRWLVFLLPYSRPMKLNWLSLLNGDLPIMTEQERENLEPQARALWRYYKKIKQEFIP